MELLLRYMYMYVHMYMCTHTRGRRRGGTSLHAYMFLPAGLAKVNSHCSGITQNCSPSLSFPVLPQPLLLVPWTTRNPLQPYPVIVPPFSLPSSPSSLPPHSPFIVSVRKGSAEVITSLRSPSGTVPMLAPNRPVALLEGTAFCPSPLEVIGVSSKSRQSFRHYRPLFLALSLPLSSLPPNQTLVAPYSRFTVA